MMTTISLSAMMRFACGTLPASRLSAGANNELGKRRRITAAAGAILVANGYLNTTTHAIAKRAKARLGRSSCTLADKHKLLLMVL